MKVRTLLLSGLVFAWLTAGQAAAQTAVAGGPVKGKIPKGGPAGGPLTGSVGADFGEPDKKKDPKPPTTPDKKNGPKTPSSSGGGATTIWIPPTPDKKKHPKHPTSPDKKKDPGGKDRRELDRLLKKLDSSREGAHRNIIEAWKRREKARYDLSLAPTSEWTRRELMDAANELKKLVRGRLEECQQCLRAAVRAGQASEEMTKKLRIRVQQGYATLMRKTYRHLDPDSAADATTFRKLVTP
jgi:hypothetical protein